MTHKELIDELSERMGEKVTKKDIEEIINLFAEIVTEELSEGNQVTFHKVGKFERRERKARKGRNPATGEEIEIPATSSAAIKVSKTLKDILNDRN